MKSHRPRRASRRKCVRNGLSVLEVTMSLLLLGVAVSGLAQLITAAAAQQRTIDARQLVLAEVANQAERVALWTAAETTADKLTTLAPSPELLAAVPTARLTAKLLRTVAADEETSPGDPDRALRVRIEVTWNDTAGREVSPLGITIWKHSREESQP
jgi:Tfp pilus assembly protein PilV